MKLDLEKGNITVYGKTSKIDSLINKLANLAGEQVYGLFGNRTILIPRRLNRLALYSVLNDKVKHLKKNSLSEKRFQDLKYYTSLSNYQLMLLFDDLCNEEDFLQYRKNLFRIILANYQALNLQDGEVSYMKSLQTSKKRIGSFLSYEEYIFAASLDEDKTFDGTNVTDLKKVLYDSNERLIREIANMYHFEFIEGSSVRTLANHLLSMGEKLEKSSITRINILDGYTPLDITVDYDALNSDDSSKKIIHYPGEENEIIEEHIEPIAFEPEEENAIEPEEEINEVNAEAEQVSQEPQEENKDDDQEVLESIEEYIDKENQEILDKLYITQEEPQAIVDDEPLNDEEIKEENKEKNNKTKYAICLIVLLVALAIASYGAVLLVI